MRCSKMLTQAFQWFTLREADAFSFVLCKWTNERAKRVENQFEKVVFVFKPSLNNALTFRSLKCMRFNFSCMEQKQHR